MKRPRAMILAVGLALLVLLVWPAVAQADTTEQVSVSTGGDQGNDDSDDPSISADGTAVAFESDATNLVAGDLNDCEDVFVRNLETGATVLVSVSSDEEQGDEGSYDPSINADGTIVAFRSYADLVEDDGEFFSQIFVRNLVSGTTQLASVNSDGDPGYGYSYDPSISADGSAVAFESSATNLVEGETDGHRNVFVHYLTGLLAGTTVLVSGSDDEVPVPGDDDSYDPSINADGTVVAFTSYATNLWAGDEGGEYFGSSWQPYEHVYVRDLVAGSTELASMNSAGDPAEGWSTDPSINADGTIVAFESDAGNLVAGDSNGDDDVFVRDLEAGTTKLVSRGWDGSPGDDDSGDPSINADGTIVAFESDATNLVRGDTNDEDDVFVHNLVAGTTKLVSRGWDGSPADDDSNDPSISADGSRVAFESEATNLVFGGVNGAYDDIFVYIAAKKQAGYPNRYEQTDPRILYSGQWETGDDQAHSGGSNYFTNDKTATITITFKGTRLDWIAALGPLMGKALVSIDGGEPVLVDLFSDTELFEQLVWSTGELEYGVHTITITFPEGSDYQEGKGINLDALDIWGVLLETTQT